MGLFKGLEEARKKELEEENRINTLPKNYKGKHYEYYVTAMSFDKEKGAAKINKLAKAGWELVSVSSPTTAAFGAVNFWLFFKREV